MLFFRTSKNAEGKQGEFSNRVGKRATLSRLRPLRCEPLEDRRMLSIGCGVYGPGVAIDPLPISPLYAAHADEISAAPTSVDLVAASDTGISDTDNLTNLDNSVSEKALQFEVSGTVPGATVTVYSDGTLIGSEMASGTTTVVTTNGSLALFNGIRTITAQQAEPGKTESEDSPDLGVTIDTISPLQDEYFITKLLADDGAGSDNFGVSVSISGSTAIVGAYKDDDNGTDSGSAYIFEQTATGWEQVAKLTAEDGEVEDCFGGSVSISGTTAIVGAGWDDDNGVDSGSAYIFEFTSAGWEQVAKLTADDGEGYDHFGTSVSISGDTVIVGANGDDDKGLDSGAAYIFEYTTTGWEQVAKLTADKGGNSDYSLNYFGSNVSVDNNTAIVGAYGDDSNGRDSGSAYVFERNATGWEQVDKLIASDSAEDDFFGYSVSINGTTAIVGALEDDTNTYATGSAYIFEQTPTGWEQVGKLTANDGEANDRFGNSVSISGTMVIVGTAHDDNDKLDSGSAYIFERTATGWEFASKLVAADNGGASQYFGGSVAISGTTAIVGMSYSSTGSIYHSGAAYTFSVPIDLQSASDTGALDTDNITSNRTPTFDIAVTPYYRIYRDGIQISGDYETAPTYTSSELDDGTYEYLVIAVDAAGNEATANSTLSVTIDNVAPVAPISTPDLQSSSDLGISDTDNLTCDNTPTFVVSDVPYFRLYRDGVQISGDIESGSYTTLPQPDGTHDYAIAGVDAAGNVSELGNPLSVTISTAIPDAPTSAPDLQATSDSGISDADNITNNTKLTFDISITGYYRLYRNDIGVSDQEIASSYTATDQPQGTYDYTIVTVDEAGNESAPGPALHVTIDTTAPLQGDYAMSKLLPDDGASSDFFGRSVSISGTTAIVGAYGDDIVGSESGSAYIFEYTANGWEQVDKLIPDDASGGGYFGTCVSIDGTTAIVGAHGDNDNGSLSGSAYIFERTAGGWEQVAKLTADDAATEDNFGYSVAISGNTVIVGAWGDDDLGSYSGSAYVFERMAGSWEQVAKLTAADGGTNNWFGYSVSISGTTAIIGANYDNDNGDGSGSAYIFKLTANGWEEVTKFVASDGKINAHFGCSVSISSNTAIVGAYNDDNNGNASGSAYVFELTTNGWTQIEKITANDATSGDTFGYSVSVSGNKVIVGAYGDDSNVSDSGSAYLFEHTATGWEQVDKLTASDRASGDYFGYSVAISDTTAMVGVRNDDDNRANSGSVYIFQSLPAIDLQSISDSGLSDTDDLTHDITPTFDISAVSYYRVYRDGVQVSGDYESAPSFTSEALHDRVYAFTVVALDAAGNETHTSMSLNVTIDTAALDQSGIIPDLLASSDLGISDTDNITNDNTPTFSVASVPGFRLYRDGIQTSDDIEIGNFTTPPQPDGTHSYAVAIIDMAGNISAIGDPISVTIDTTAPVATTIAPDLQATGDSGLSDTDNITNDSTPTFDIETTGYYRLYCNGVLVSGDYETSDSYTTAAQPDGTYDYTIVAVDEAGNESLPSPALLLTIDSRELFWNDLIVSKITASDGTQEGFFGTSVSLSGSMAIVGAEKAYNDGIRTGAAYILQQTDTGWEEVAKLTADDGAPYDCFGLSVSISGTTAIVGAFNNNHGGGSPGAAYIFEQTANGWEQVAKLTVGEETGVGRFGYNVAISGTTAIVGASGDNENGFDSGSAYIFEQTATGWKQVAKLLADDGAESDLFGYSVSISGTRAIVGAKWDDDNGNSSGSVYVFEQTSTGWEQIAKLTADDGASGDYFGYSVSISDTTAIVGAMLDDDNGSSSGSAYIFEQTDTGWEQVAKLTADDAGARDAFGCSVSIDGTTAVVGANADNGYTGSAYIFHQTENGWEQVNKLTAYDGAIYDYFGTSVAIDGDTVLAGANSDDDNGYYSGSAYMFSLTSAAPTIDLQDASDTGQSNTDNITADITPTFDISATSYYRLYRDGVQVSGDYETASTYTSPILSHGTYEFTVRAVDVAGNESSSGDSLIITISPSTLIFGDANGDGDVTGSDVTILAANWQAGVSDGRIATWSMGDFNYDGKVDGSDVTILAANWQRGHGPKIVDHSLDDVVSPTDSFTITFDEPIDPTTFTVEDITLVGPRSEPIGSYHYEDNHIYDVTVSGSLAYVADTYNCLQIVDVSDPTAPTYVGSYGTSAAYDVAIVGTLAYVANDALGLHILDVSDPTSPTLVGTYDTLSHNYGRAYGVTVIGNLAYIAAYCDGLQIIDVSDPSAPTLVGRYDTGDYTYEVAVSGSIAYVTDKDNGLQILDVSDPSVPTLIGNYASDRANGLTISGTIAYLADSSDGLQIIDISNPASPTLISSLRTENACDVTILGQLAFVADSTYGLKIIDVSDPTSPTYIGCSTPWGRAYGVAVSGSLVYLANNTGGLQIIDVFQEISGVVQVDDTTWRIDLPGLLAEKTHFVSVGPNITDLLGNVMDQDEDGTGGESPQDTYTFNFHVDTTAPSVPESLAIIENSGVTDDTLTNDASPMLTWAESYDAGGVAGYEYCLDGGEWLWTEDLSSEELSLETEGDHLLEVRAVDLVGLKSEIASLTVTLDTTAPTAPTNLCLDGAVLHWNASDDASGIGKYEFRIDGTRWNEIDIEEALTGLADGQTVLLEVRATDLAGNASSIASTTQTINYGPQVTNNNTSHVVTPIDSFTVTFNEPIDPTTLTAEDITIIGPQPELIGSYSNDDYVGGVTVVGMFAYVVQDNHGLQILDVSDPTLPTLVGSYDTNGIAFNVEVVGTTAYMTNGDNGLLIIDVSSPASPTLIGNCNIDSSAYDVAISGTIAYVVCGNDGLNLIDISVPSAPTLLGSYDTTGFAKDVKIVGPLAYVAAGSDGLLVIDTSDPTSPTLVGSYDASYIFQGHERGQVFGVTISDNLAYLAANALQVIDITDPTFPTLVSRFNDSGNAYGVTISNTLAYTANGSNGLQIVDISNPATPILVSSYNTTSVSAYNVAISDTLVYVANSYNGLQILETTPIPNITSITQIDATTYCIQLADTLPEGEISVSIGPNITDPSGNTMDQDANGAGGQTQEDVYEFNFTVDKTANVPPTADAGGPYTCDLGDPVTLDASGSTDLDNNIVLYEWDLDSDGQYDDATGPTVEYYTPNIGTYTVAVKVTDDKGESDTDSAEVTSLLIYPFGDANYDGKVDGSDVTILAANWQTGVMDGQIAIWSMGDFNGDGKVDGSDVTILACNWQAGMNSAVTAVSEPESEPTRQFTPPANASLGVATVPTHKLLPARRFIAPTLESTDVALVESSSWSSSDVAAIAKDLTLVSVKKSIAATDELFALGLDPYGDLE